MHWPLSTSTVTVDKYLTLGYNWALYKYIIYRGNGQIFFNFKMYVNFIFTCLKKLFRHCPPLEFFKPLCYGKKKCFPKCSCTEEWLHNPSARYYFLQCTLPLSMNCNFHWYLFIWHFCESYKMSLASRFQWQMCYGVESGRELESGLRACETLPCLKSLWQ